MSTYDYSFDIKARLAYRQPRIIATTSPTTNGINRVIASVGTRH